MKINIINLISVIFCVVILSFSLRGLVGVPSSDQLNSPKWIEYGPFELSPERGRFALLYSLAEDRSFQFSDNLGKFASPDVAISNGKFASLFPPLLSFITIPGYILGKYFGASQVGTFAIVSLFAIFNFILIRAISVRLGANNLAATLGALVFLFATPAFSYAVNLYQHHISTFLILLSIYSLLRFKGIGSLLIVFFLCSLAIPLDYPNLFFLFPIGIFALSRIISFNNLKNKISISINLIRLLTPIIMIFPILFFLWFNQSSFGNPFQISGTLPSAKTAILENKKISEISQRPNNSGNAINFFKSRNLLNGFYVHFVSPDRGIIYYSPIVLFGFLGAFLAYKKKVHMVSLLIAIIGANILLYSMWGDPWGGWAFGSRYLIPSYAILSIFIALLLSYWGKKYIFQILFLIISFYSFSVNTLGAITTSAMPPQAEVLDLEKKSGKIELYTYQRNWEIISSGNTKSFIYQTFLKNYINPVQFLVILTSSIIIFSGGIYFLLISRRETNV